MTGEVIRQGGNRSLGAACVEQAAELGKALAFGDDDAMQFDGFRREQDRDGFPRKAFERLRRWQFKNRFDVFVNELIAQIVDDALDQGAAVVPGARAALGHGAHDPHARQLLAKEARRAADIVDRVRGMAARSASERVLVSLHDVILEALQLLRHEVEWRGIAVTHVFSSTPSNVLADRTLLHQLIVNLAVNAMQAMAQTGASERNITVRTTLSDEITLRCSFEDSGPGIEPDHLPRLFDSFFTTKQGGMGMGLSVCRSIIEAHGGRIEADNGSVHGGARFSFALPAASQVLH